MKDSILFLLPYPLQNAPSQRFRVEAFLFLLDEKKFHFKTNEFFNEKTWRIMYQKGGSVRKGIAVLTGFLKRFGTVLFSAPHYEYIFIHREAAPIGPPFFEWLLTKIFRKKVIYDFDDAIWIPNISESNKIAGLLKCYWKVKWICKWADKVSVGNRFLGDYALQFNKNVVYNPTCVDTSHRYFQTADQERLPITIGWTGSHSTLQFLVLAVPALKKLALQHSFRFLVICDQQPDFELDGMEFVKWNKDTEIEDLCAIQIGIMPLKHDAWSEGKCGFKIIQYLALGIPAVASPVGVNKDIIEHGTNGYLCENDEDWVLHLSDLLQDKNRRISFGRNGQKKIQAQYSISSNASTFVSLFSN